MRRSAAIVVALAACMAAAHAQDARQSFQEFRKGLHSDYNSFRNRILEHYADFLNGEWHPYEPMKERERYDRPKPEKAPAITSRPGVPDISDKPEARPRQGAPAPGEQGARHGTPAGENMSDTDSFDFYGMSLSIPHVDFCILDRVRRTVDTAAQWRALEKGGGRSVARHLKSLADGMGLNGYLTLRLAEAYIKSRFTAADDAARFTAVHYMLANMGYDVRLALTDKGRPLLLMPFVQTVYASVYLNIDGRNYTALSPEDSDAAAGCEGSIYTCPLPAGSDAGAMSDLKLDGLTLPYRPHRFDISGAGIRITGEVNENLFRMLYRYPQMPTEDFASSVLDSKLRASVVSQVAGQLAGMEHADAVNTLMGFFHQGFPYATDQERHGFEKPYFLEEMLYYDRCDCEDRAIMFTYLVWHALGLPVHLNAYPGHESAAVAVDASDAGPYSYTCDGHTFRNTDPTYIGSRIGDVMPQFAATAPKIDKAYK